MSTISNYEWQKWIVNDSTDTFIGTSVDKNILSALVQIKTLSPRQNTVSPQFCDGLMFRRKKRMQYNTFSLHVL